MDVFQVLGWIYIITNYIVIFPLLWYYLSKLHSVIQKTRDNKNVMESSDGHTVKQNNGNNNNSDHNYFITNLIAVRSPTFIYMISIISFTGILIERPLLCIRRVLLINIMPIWLSRTFGVLLMVGILTLFAIKSYYLYFKQKYNTIISEISWRVNINPTEAYNNWYYKNNQRFGNVTWLIKFSSIPFIILILTEMIQIFYGKGNETIFILIHLILLIIPISVMIMVFYKLYKHKIKDIYKLSNEVKYQLIILGISTFIYIFILLLLDKAVWDNDQQQIKWLFTCYISTFILLFLCTTINLKYPLIIIEQHKNHTLVANAQKIKSMSELDNKSEYRLSIQAMQDCLSNYDTFKLFMQHLVQEFACENLLFLTGIFIYTPFFFVCCPCLK